LVQISFCRDLLDIILSKKLLEKIYLFASVNYCLEIVGDLLSRMSKFSSRPSKYNELQLTGWNNLWKNLILCVCQNGSTAHPVNN
jgi:hypothetical protein